MRRYEERVAEGAFGKECLIVLDDVWDSRVVGAFQLPGFRGKLLVTTRDVHLNTPNSELVEILPSDCGDFAEPLLARLALRGSLRGTASCLPSQFQVRLHLGCGL